jgi:hypothetical protein
MTPKQYNLALGLLSREGLAFAQEDLAYEYSNGRTRSLEKLDYRETQNLFAQLRQPSPKDKMKRKILSMAHEMRWELGSGKVDMVRLNAWCVKHTPSHTVFNSIPVKDLPKVVSIYEKMYNEFLKRL